MKSIKQNKTYKYLLSYIFRNIQYIDVPGISDPDIKQKCEANGSGRMVLSLTKKIETEQDIVEVENIIKEELANSNSVENLISLSLCSFNLLKG